MASGSRRRAPGEGTLEHLSNGKWRAIAQKGKHRIKGRQSPTRAGAIANLKIKLKDLERESESRSFSQYAQAWLTRSTKKLSQTTVDTYGRWIKASLIDDPIGKLAVHKITASDLKAWLNRQSNAATTNRKRLAFLLQLLRSAGHPIEIQLPKVEEHNRRPLTPDERAAMLTSQADFEDSMRMAILLCWYVGLRRSEACGLKHEDRDGDGVNIQRVCVITNKSVLVKAKAKTSKSNAWVPLPPGLRPLIGPPRTGFVIGNGEKPAHPKTISEALRRLLKDTSLAKVPHMGLHALRRTFGMTLLESGVDVVTAARAMRHDPVMLMKEYARTRQDLLIDAVDRAFPGSPTHNDTPK